MSENESIRLNEWILIIGTCLAPMTGLRIWKIGPGELLCLAYCILNIGKIRFINGNNVFFRFWIVFLGASFLGTIWGTMMYPNETNLVGISTWIYLAIVSIGISCSLEGLPSKHIQLIIERVVKTSTVLYGLLYVYSINISKSFMGVPLWYGNVRFTAGATNPHQIALMLSFSVVVLLWRVINGAQIWGKLHNTVLLALAYFLMSETQSSTALMATIVAVFILIIQTLWVRTDNRRVLFLVYIASLLIILLFSRQLYRLILSWIQEDSNGNGRILLFSSFPTTFYKSPLIGLGPGTHALNGRMEFHNTYLEILAMSGIIGFSAYIIFTIRIFNISSLNTLSLSALVAGYMFGVSGFGARRLIYWVLIVLCTEMAASDEVQTKECSIGGFSKYIKPE